MLWRSCTFFNLFEFASVSDYLWLLEGRILHGLVITPLHSLQLIEPQVYITHGV